MATIQGVYIALFGRPADPLGLAFFNTATSNGQNLNAIGNLASTAEYQGRFTGQSNVQIINSIYQSLFGRDADVAGLTFFANQLSSGRQTINTIAINILDGATGSDRTIINNKEAAANLYTAAIDTGSEIVAYSGTAAADAGRAFISGVTTTVPTQAAVDAAVAAMVVSAPANGTTFTLTTGVDNIVGTSNNDTINGFKSATNPTLTAADVINGGGGVDTLNITVDQAGNVLAGAQLSSIEVVGIRAIANTANELDATGLTGVVLTGTNTSTTALTNLANGATVTVGTGANLTGAITAGYVAAATTANLAYTGGTSGALTANGATAFTTANITSTGAANTAGAINVGAATAINVNATTNFTATSIATTGTNSTLTVSGAAASVNVGALDEDLRTINASGLTAGGLTATLSNAAQVVTGGAGNDVISTGNLGLLTGSVNAGAGTADRLVLTATADLDSTAKAARYTGFEVLQVSDNTSGNLDNIAGITAIRISDAGNATAVTNLTAAQAGAITVVAADGVNGAITIGVKGAATVGQIDTVALTIDDGATTVGTLALGTPVMAGVEKLTINAVDNYTIAALTGSPALDSITLTGAATHGITFDNGAIASNFAVNGSAATGVLTINATAATGNGVGITGGSANDVLTGSAQGDVVNGGAGNDTLSGLAGNDTITGGDGIDSITGGAGADTLTGGAGVDTFVFTTLTDSLAANADRITDFVAGTDKIDVTNIPASILQGAAYTAAGTGTLATDIATALTAGGGTLGANVAIVTLTGTGAGTYLVLGDNTTPAYAAGEDAVINITGLTGTLTVADFV